MREAVIVSTARTPIGKAYRGAFNDTPAQALGGHAIAEAVKRARLDPAEIGDVVMGAALQQGFQGGNIARQCALRAGLPVTVAGMSVDRQCASGMMAIATAATSGSASSDITTSRSSHDSKPTWTPAEENHHRPGKCDCPGNEANPRTGSTCSNPTPQHCDNGSRRSAPSRSTKATSKPRSADDDATPADP